MISARIPRVLSIAGSDSGGGAGIQADLKAFARAGVHGMTVITAITAQSTVSVDRVQVIAPEMIVAQVRAVASDIGVDAVKVGMLATAETVAAVVAALEVIGDVPVVVDPVMVAESGARLLDPDACDALRELLVPRASVITPNVPEARVLAHADAARAPELLAVDLLALGPEVAVVTGGHRAEAIDVFCDANGTVALAGTRYDSGASHGSGCTHSATLAAALALGLEPLAAAREAQRVASEAVRDGLTEIGAGAGPVDVLGLARRHRGAPRSERATTSHLT